jgi:hypothetical protein
LDPGHPDAECLVKRPLPVKFNKGEVVQCKNCEAWMAAPDNVRVDGLTCASCHSHIWPAGVKPGDYDEYPAKPGVEDDEPKLKKSRQQVTIPPAPFLCFPSAVSGPGMHLSLAASL